MSGKRIAEESMTTKVYRKKSDVVKKDGNGEIWINVYPLAQFLHQNQSELEKVTDSKEWKRIYQMREEAKSTVARIIIVQQCFCFFRPHGGMKKLFSEVCSLTQSWVKDSFTNTKTLWCNLKKLINIDVIDCLL